ncbi:MAG TPA: hypothetical protein VE136_09815 [Anaerolineales bacterium]|nr:hypothetical protein [Anaerolineales bacterium]
MKPNRLSRKAGATLCLLIFVTMGLAGCGNIEVVTMESGPSETPRNGAGSIEVGIEPTPTPESRAYSHETYGFKFTYPETWALSEEDHGVILMKGTNRLEINFRWADEQIEVFQFGRTGIPAGDFIYAGKVNFMDQVIPAEVLLYDKKSKAIFYEEPGRPVKVKDLEFLIVLEDLETDYSEVDLSEETMAEAKTILESFKWLERRPTTEVHEEPALEASLKRKYSVQTGSVEPLELNFLLENQSQEALYLLKWYTPLEGIAGDIFDVARDGQAIPYLGVLATRGNPTPESYILLEPGKSVSTDINIEAAYDFSQPGLYTIKFRSPRISHIARSEAEMATTLDELGPVKIPSNEINVLMNGLADRVGMPSARTIDEARATIAAYLQDQKPGEVEVPSLQIEEVPFVEASAIGPEQIFKVTGRLFRNESFLLNGDHVIQLGDASGGKGLTSLAISDLDGDSRAELLFTYSCGLGPQFGSREQSRVGVYAPAYDSTRTFEANMAYTGDMNLLAESATEVVLQVPEPDQGTGEPPYQVPIGRLSIDHHNEGFSLVLEVAPDLPADIQEDLLTIK